MKFDLNAGTPVQLKSPSPRRAWIEMNPSPATRSPAGSPSPRRAWIEMLYRRAITLYGRMSPSPRRAWIEMIRHSMIINVNDVALPSEGVD